MGPRSGGGALLVDIVPWPRCTTAALAGDRLHLSLDGHARVAAAVLDTLGVHAPARRRLPRVVAPATVAGASRGAGPTSWPTSAGWAGTSAGWGRARADQGLQSARARWRRSVC